MADINYLASTISARNQMEFQREMSNTAHQREVEDLKKAGLNPVLSAHTQGASTPTGAEGDYGDMAGVFDALSKSLDTNAKAVSSALRVATKAIEKSENAGGIFGDVAKNIGDTFGKRYPWVKLLSMATDYALKNGEIGNITTSGSSAKARQRYLNSHKDVVIKPDANVNPDSSYRWTSLPGFNTAKNFVYKVFDNLNQYNRKQYGIR